MLSLVEPDEAKPFRRGARGTYVLAVFERPEHPEPIEESLRADYPMLLRALANLVLDYVPGEGAWFTTMERGHYGVPADSTTRSSRRHVIERLVPLASSRLIIDNEFKTDLEPELWEGDEITESIRDAGVRLGALNLLPNPFPIEDLLTERELRHVKRLYGIGGLSYGNLSARKDDTRFWMSASGVDKTKLDIPGRDILLVSDYDVANGRMVLSVPPGVEPRRVSVDAIEHWMIYQEHPGVGAIVHVHAWVDGIDATDVNYPCGTEELARAVADLVRAEDDPDNADRRPAEPRHHRHRPEPRGDPRPHRAARARRDPYDLDVNLYFVCVGNAGRSQMAEAFAKQAGHDARSAGSRPAAALDPEVVEVMRELDIDLSGRVPRGITTRMSSGRTSS